MLREISKIILKLVDIRWCADFPLLSFPFFNLRQMRRGVFQSDPILETLLSYYSSSGVGSMKFLGIKPGILVVCL